MRHSARRVFGACGGAATMLALLGVQPGIRPARLSAAHLPMPAASRQDSTALRAGAVIERQLSGRQSHRYQLTLPAGDFVRITVEQRGIDVAVKLVRPDGRDLLAIDASDDDFRPETIVAIADVTGRFTLDIRPAPSAGPRGRYAVRVDELRPAAALDGVRVEAERAYARGRRLTVNGLPRAWPGALEEFSRALDRYRQVGDRSGELKAWIELGNVQQNLLQPDALASAQQAEHMARELRDQPARAAALHAIGAAHQQAGDHAAALRAYEESTAISHGIANRRAEASSINGEGGSYLYIGEYEKGIARFDQAFPLVRATNDRRIEILLLYNTSAAYEALGQDEKASDLLQHALSLARARNDTYRELQIVNRLGSLQSLMGHDEKALELLTAALALARQIGVKKDEAASINLIGFTYYDRGEYGKALDHHREALAISRKLGDSRQMVISLSGVGNAMHRLGDDQALGALREALTILRDLRRQYLEIDLLHDIAAVEGDTGHLPEALGHIEAAVDLDETLRAQMTSPELRATFTAAAQDKYELFIDLLQQRHATNPSGGHMAAALQVSERARARVLLESLLDARVDLRQGVEPALLEHERLLQRQLNDASEEASGSTSKNRESQEAAAQTLERLTADYQQLQAQVRQQSPRYAAVTQPQPLGAAEIQQSVIDADTVLLEFALGEERSWLWAVTTNTIASVELPPRRDLEAAAQSLYGEYTARQKRRGERSLDYTTRVAAADALLGKKAAAVSQMLLGGIADQLNDEWRGKRLAIVAAGALEYLPFGALPIPESAPAADRAETVPARHRSSSVPLASAHEIATIPSASVLAVLRREAASREPAPRTLAILADAVFERSDPRVTSRPAHRTSLVQDDAAPRGIDFANVAWVRKGFSRLPFSREEALAITALTDANQVFMATDFKASRATVLGGVLSGHRIVHFATHGVLDSERPSLSGLILSLVDERGARQNGYLRLHDIYNMRLDADLVVLSACQTALGKQIKGEGLIGLTRAFMYAGASRVVASLWEVSDLATAELMKKFYRGMLKQRLPPAAALRAAQLQLAQDPRWASPYYWAGFVFQGDWK